MKRWWPVLLLLALGAAAVFWTRGAGRERGGDTSSASVAELLGTPPVAGFNRAVHKRRFSFPADHRPHPGFRNEWWYFTGNLQTAEGRQFGYQLTFFRAALLPDPIKRESRWGANEVYLAHFAVTDVKGARFHAAERFSRAALGLAGAGGDPLVVHLEDWAAREVGSEPWSMRLTAEDGPEAIDLTVRQVLPPVLNGEAGLSRKSSTSGNASYYYSVPRMATEGIVRVEGETFRVSGLSWFDREWSTSALEPGQTGWDWFALHLDDGRSVMIYRIRRKDGTPDPSSSGTVVAVDGTARILAASDAELQVTDRWRSPVTGVEYPSRWRLKIPSERLDLDIVPMVAGQELVVTFRYWEGAVRVVSVAGGAPLGNGYVELTGYDDQSATRRGRVPVAE